MHALVERGATHLLEALAAEVDALAAGLRRPLHLIAESDLNDPKLVTSRDARGYGLAAQWWSWPGNTADSALIRQVRDDLREWNLARVVWVADRGFASAENRRYLQREAGHYILGEKLRGGTPAADAALSRQGRYQKVRGNLEVKEVKLDKDLADDRFVVCYDPPRSRTRRRAT